MVCGPEDPAATPSDRAAAVAAVSRALPSHADPSRERLLDKALRLEPAPMEQKGSPVLGEPVGPAMLDD